ncbi:SigB/SigF/SigG family RNA polymerase sigma factor [Streptomyces sp. NPDC048566]|uniref:SigB/SigF/SigG family RNA polymerase sigma factor n=1 Tax=Streptomyces sp. NPDC048566 TaxID=3365569 RepID=UPI003718EDC1
MRKGNHLPSSARDATKPSTVARHTHDDAPDDVAAPLFRQLARADEGPDHDAARAELVSLWLPMAHRIAGRFRNRGEDIDDLRQVAALGLVKAIDRYDPDRGAFETYAVPTVTGEVKRHFRDRAWAVRVPRRVQELRNQVRLARRDLTQRPGGGSPTHADIATRTGLSEHDVATGMEALESYSTLSLDAAGTPDGRSLVESLGDCDPSYDLVVDREAAKEAVRHLTQRERDVLYLRFFQGMTQTRIAEHLGCSQMHVSRLIKRSCSQVREEVLHEDPGSS